MAWNHGRRGGAATDIEILFGTETGNAEIVAYDVAEALGGRHTVTVTDLADVDVATLRPDALYLVICSTQGDGEMPLSAEPFADAMRDDEPDLTGLRYAMFGMGDSTYPYYSLGSEHIDALLRTAGAVRVGRYGRHDAASLDDPSDLAAAWARDVLQGVLADAA